MRLLYNSGVAVRTNFQVIGIGKTQRAKIEAAISQVLGTRPGRWSVQFIGSGTDDMWEMRVSGPVVETTELLDGSLGQHTPEFISDALARIASE